MTPPDGDNVVHDDDDPTADVGDADLVLRARSGDQWAFSELWRRHHRSGLTAARSITSSLDPEDLVQEAYTRIYQAIQRGGGPTGSFRAYLFTSIRNTAAGWGRARRETALDDLDAIVDPDSTAHAADEALDRGLTHQAFQSLPTRWQEVLWYSEIESMKPAEIAPLLGMKPTAVAQLTFRAREGLREAWIQAHLRSVTDGSDCEWTIHRLGAYARNNLGVRDLTKVENHLTDCARCTIVAAEASHIGSRLALVLLPATIGIGAAGAYLASLQGGGTPIAALAAMPSSVMPGAVTVVSSPGGATAGATATGSPTGIESGGGSAGGAGAGAGAAGAGAGGGILSGSGLLIGIAAASVLIAASIAIVLPNVLGAPAATVQAEHVDAPSKPTASESTPAPRPSDIPAVVTEAPFHDPVAPATPAPRVPAVPKTPPPPIKDQPTPSPTPTTTPVTPVEPTTPATPVPTAPPVPTLPTTPPTIVGVDSTLTTTGLTITVVMEGVAGSTAQALLDGVVVSTQILDESGTATLVIEPTFAQVLANALVGYRYIAEETVGDSTVIDLLTLLGIAPSSTPAPTPTPTP